MMEAVAGTPLMTVGKGDEDREEIDLQDVESKAKGVSGESNNLQGSVPRSVR